MRRILFGVIGLALVLALAFTAPAFAGGWAVVTLDDLPGQVVADEPLEIGFMVRQHGVRPMEGLSPVIYADAPGFGQSLTFTAEEDTETGHYLATITLPEAGKWEWTIEAFGPPQPMPALTVLAAAPAAAKPAETAPSIPVTWPEWLPALLGAASLLVGLVTVLQRKARWAIALILAGVVVSAASIVSAADQPRPQSASAPQDQVSSAESSISQVELGHQLFVAKGCMICHSHSATNSIREFGTDVGPNLTDFTASPDYLRIWLKDPKEVRSTAQMPQLELSEVEIEALIAFINDN